MSSDKAYTCDERLLTFMASTYIKCATAMFYQFLNDSEVVIYWKEIFDEIDNYHPSFLLETVKLFNYFLSESLEFTHFNF